MNEEDLKFLLKVEEVLWKILNKRGNEEKIKNIDNKKFQKIIKKLQEKTKDSDVVWDELQTENAYSTLENFLNKKFDENKINEIYDNFILDKVKSIDFGDFDNLEKIFDI